MHYRYKEQQQYHEMCKGDMWTKSAATFCGDNLDDHFCHVGPWNQESSSSKQIVHSNTWIP